MARHAKTDSDVTSLAASTPPRSPRGRPAYYVLSPAASHPDVHLGASGRAAEKMSLAGSTPAESPLHYHFHSHHHRHSGAVAGVGGGAHHSRESSTGRLLYSDRSVGDVAAVVSAPWRLLGHGSGAGSDDEDEDVSLHGGYLASPQWRCYALGAFAFMAVFAFFLLVLWGASRSYKAHVVVKSVVFESYHIQGGTDRTGVPTKMMSVNATVRLRFRNRGTFFSLHVTATPFLLFYGDLTVASSGEATRGARGAGAPPTPLQPMDPPLSPSYKFQPWMKRKKEEGRRRKKRRRRKRKKKGNFSPPNTSIVASPLVASGELKEFYQPRKSGRVVTVSVVGKQVPLYGAGVSLHSKPNNGRLAPAVVPVRLAFVLRVRAHILGLLVKSKFYRRVHCGLDIREAHLGRPVRGVAADCDYHDGR